MAAGDLKRGTSGVVLPAQVSSEIWASTQQASAVMAVSRQIALPGSGITIPLITGDSVAAWVNESAEKPVSHATLGNKSMTPYKLAVIETFSMEFRRDLPRLPGALAKKFDETVLAGTAPGSGFDVLSGAPSLTVDGTNTYADLAAVFTAATAVLLDIPFNFADVIGLPLAATCPTGSPLRASRASCSRRSRPTVVRCSSRTPPRRVASGRSSAARSTRPTPRSRRRPRLATTPRLPATSPTRRSTAPSRASRSTSATRPP